MSSQIERQEKEVQLDPLEWLASRPEAVKIYWSSRDRDIEIAGVGIADEIVGHDAHLSELDALLEKLEKQDPAICYFGGLRFDLSKTPSPEWAPFGAYRFILPAIEVRRVGNKTTLAHHHRHQTPLPQAGEGDFDSSKSGEGETRKKLTPSDFTWWQTAVTKAQKEINSGRIEKVVLARRVPRDFLPFVEMCRSAPWGYHFYFQVAQDTAFMGVSPEQLYFRDGLRIQTEAQAGTRKRGATPEQDEQLENELLKSAKEQQEQRFVVDFVRTALDDLCLDHGLVNDQLVTKLPNVQHLRSTYGGILRPGISDRDVIKRLHPTPAVGGVPSREALELIAEIEPFDRGYYAGAVGTISANQVELAVGIRSFLKTADGFYNFAGAGIVKDSIASEEWAEIEAKLFKK